MKRELKEIRALLYQRELQRSNRTTPYEEGTESEVPIESVDVPTSNRTTPYEEGTERGMPGRGAHAVDRVTEPLPMKRELKVALKCPPARSS